MSGKSIIAKTLEDYGYTKDYIAKALDKVEYDKVWTEIERYPSKIEIIERVSEAPPRIPTTVTVRSQSMRITRVRRDNVPLPEE